MGNYLPSTDAQQREMLAALGLSEKEELFSSVPRALRAGALDMPNGKPEFEVLREMERLAAQNTVFPSVFRGAGAYRHYIPAIVKSVTSKESFVTAYTPYQAELSQGVLQSIFEYQTMICELTGLAAANASVYDGATAAAEAAALCRERGRTKTLLSAGAHPDVIAVVQTYCYASGHALELIPLRDGATDLDALAGMIDGTVSAVYMQQPNYFGLIEDCARAAQVAHAGGAKFIMGVNPIAAAILKSPGECGADIAVGEGQPLGMPLSFGGPYLGFMASTTALMRKLPGRIVGQTVDADGRCAFTLTLQAREQHIRREKAASNICSNQALCAMTAAVYLAAMGPQGLKEVAEQCMAKAHYLAERLDAIGFHRVHCGAFFHEFLTTCPGNVAVILKALEARGILGGLEIEGNILWCATEMNSKEEIDRLVEVLG
ncbi:MAG: aminomethyl-transferring glycine dehydrogenase subunit GcvPA [Clostridiales bacterium]|nr:aminomethyl-transferring glycine dehydrogenase subunit GcvPA [Clostridiales bacterium]